MAETAASSDLKPERPDELLSHDTVDLKSDLGFFIEATKSAEDIERSVRSMSKGQKYHLLKHHDKPSCHYIFPTQYLGGCNRSFQLRWIEEYGWWLVYSSKLDGAFCVCCALFANARDRKNMGVMVNAHNVDSSVQIYFISFTLEHSKTRDFLQKINVENPL